MPLLPVFLPTDVLLWLLVIAAVGYGIYCARRPHLAQPWSRVFRSPGAVVAGVLLGCYLLIGLADSLHFRARLEQASASGQAAYAPEVLSLLDVALARLRAGTERSYSAPLATRAFVREMVEQPDGTTRRGFPRLRQGGAHLEDESQWTEDIARRALLGLACGAALWLLLLWSIRPLMRRAPAVPWRAGLITVGVLLALSGPVVVLAGGYHVLGTDKVGQDVLLLSLKSVRTSLVIGTLTTLVILPFGITFGVVAGYFRGWVDDVIQYVYTTLNSIPGVLLIAAAVLMMQVYVDSHPDLFPTAAQRADLRLLFLCIILGVTSWTGLTRLLRGETLKLAELEYVQAAHAFGVSHGRVLSRHLVPNLMHIVVISVAIDFSTLVLTEAVLSYIGVGVDPTTVSFGTMINGARLEMSREPIVWWSLSAAFVFMFTLVLSANLLADAVRDAFDPRVRIGVA
ncbi:MAG: peptide ABC transporter permease [Betaproteobacteria bacterium SG8_39]|nr:MAG: peptide ABC transporter permease [Betaproteobacteria bacterium SG8_39]